MVMDNIRFLEKRVYGGDESVEDGVKMFCVYGGGMYNSYALIVSYSLGCVPGAGIDNNIMALFGQF